MPSCLPHGQCNIYTTQCRKEITALWTRYLDCSSLLTSQVGPHQKASDGCWDWGRQGGVQPWPVQVAADKEQKQRVKSHVQTAGVLNWNAQALLLVGTKQFPAQSPCRLCTQPTLMNIMPSFSVR